MIFSGNRVTRKEAEEEQVKQAKKETSEMFAQRVGNLLKQDQLIKEFFPTQMRDGKEFMDLFGGDLLERLTEFKRNEEVMAQCQNELEKPYCRTPAEKHLHPLSSLPARPKGKITMRQIKAIRDDRFKDDREIKKAEEESKFLLHVDKYTRKVRKNLNRCVRQHKIDTKTYFDFK